jgi:hypothetical protein
VIDPSSLADARVQELARSILAREEYARYRPLDLEAWRAGLERIARALVWLSRLSVEQPLLWALLLGGLLALAALLLAHVVYSMRSAVRARPPTARHSAASGPDLRGQAERLVAAGRFLDAAHVVQLACLRELVERGALELRRHEPNPVLRAQVASSGLPEAERREFLALLDRLETRWFRDRAPELGDRALFEAWHRLLERLSALGASA